MRRRNRHQLRYDWMPFGKHKGQRFECIPTDYLCWLLREGIDDRPLMRAVESEMERREKPTDYLLWRMDSEISDDEFGKIAEELDRRCLEEPIAGWGTPDHKAG